MSPPDTAHLTPQTLEEAGDGSEPLEHLSPSSISACVSNQALLRTAPQVCHNPGWKTQLVATSSPPSSWQAQTLLPAALLARPPCHEEQDLPRASQATEDSHSVRLPPFDRV